jgi:hypothetical protein
MAAERVGIPLARDARSRGHPRAAIDAVPPPYEADRPLRCGGCDVGVRGTRSHSRRVADGDVIQVMAYYSVVNHGEHERGCRYDFRHRAQQLIRDSRGTVVRKGEVYELRMPEPDTVEPVDQLRPSAGGVPRARLEVSVSDRELAPSLGSAAQIVRLLHEFDDDPDAVRRFRVRHAGRTFTWERFCRSTGELASIASFLRMPTAGQHPLALYGTVRSVRSSRRGDSRELCDDQSGFLDLVGEERRLTVVVRSRNAKAFAKIGVGDQWLGYGKWGLWIPDRKPFAEIQLWVDGPWSIATWQD